jgi:hypothetical protein
MAGRGTDSLKREFRLVVGGENGRAVRRRTVAGSRAGTIGPAKG